MENLTAECKKCGFITVWIQGRGWIHPNTKSKCQFPAPKKGTIR